MASASSKASRNCRNPDSSHATSRKAHYGSSKGKIFLPLFHKYTDHPLIQPSAEKQVDKFVCDQSERDIRSCIVKEYDPYQEAAKTKHREHLNGIVRKSYWRSGATFRLGRRGLTTCATRIKTSTKATRKITSRAILLRHWASRGSLPYGYCVVLICCTDSRVTTSRSVRERG